MKFCTKCTKRHHAKGLCRIHYDGCYKPKQQRGPALIFRTDQETYNEVFAYAKANNTTASEAVRTFIEWGLEVERKNKSSEPLRRKHDLRNDKSNRSVGIGIFTR